MVFTISYKAQKVIAQLLCIKESFVCCDMQGIKKKTDLVSITSYADFRIALVAVKKANFFLS
jgi:hypothetical protein